MDNVKDKIEKLLKQTVENGATEAEATSSLLLARKLMLKYKIDERDLSSSKSDACQLELNFDFTLNEVWTRQLLHIFVDNCGIFTYTKNQGNNLRYILFGLKVDVECVEVLFNCAYEFVYKNSLIAYEEYVELFGECEDNGKSLRELYIQGFISGLEYKYHEQNKSDKNFELMIVPDKKIKDAYEDLTRDFQKVNITNDIKFAKESEMIRRGFNDGKMFGTTGLNNGNLKLKTC